MKNYVSRRWGTLDSSEEKFSRIEMRKAVLCLKHNKTAGINGITVKLIKAGTDITIEIFYILVKKKAEMRILDEWEQGIIVKLCKKGIYQDVKIGDQSHCCV